MQQMHAFISGYVQGVCFRYYTVQRVKALGLKGFVRNLPDGRVEVLAQGEKPDLERLAAWLKHGPSGASVKKVEICWEKAEKEFKGFGVRY